MRRVMLFCVMGCVLASPRMMRAQQGAGGGHMPEHADHMEHSFADAERYAKSFDDPARDAWQMPARVIEALALQPQAKVADIGAGTGYFSVRLARAAAAPTVFAVDIEPKMVEYLTSRAASEHLPNLRAVRATAEGPNLPEPVDVVSKLMPLLVLNVPTYVCIVASWYAAIAIYAELGSGGADLAEVFA